MPTIKGQCHCGNISYVAEFSNAPSTYPPRLCDCEFCTSHNAAYTSDPHGSLTIHIQNSDQLIRYRQGSKIADFIICKSCGVLTNVVYEENNRIYASVNISTSDDPASFGCGKSAQLMRLSDKERITRWKDYWFQNVEINYT